MNKLTPIIIAGALIASGCGDRDFGHSEADLARDKEVVKLAMAGRAANLAIEDYQKADSAEEQFYLQFLDREAYALTGLGEFSSYSWDWKVGDDCLRETLYTTRDLKRDPGITASPTTRDNGRILRIQSAGIPDLVFERTDEKLVPSGTQDELEHTLGVLDAQNCEYGVRIVEYRKIRGEQDAPYSVDKPLPADRYGY